MSDHGAVHQARATGYARGRREVLSSAPFIDSDDECSWCIEVGGVCVWHRATAEGAVAFAEAVSATASDPDVEHTVRAVQEAHRTGQPLEAPARPRPQMSPRFTPPPTPTGEAATFAPLSHLGAVLAEVGRAVLVQTDHRWQQTHADGTGREAFGEVAELLRLRADDAFVNGRGTWRHLLAVEVGTAFAQTHLDRLRADLVGVAALAVSWAQDVDRRVAEDPQR